MPFSLSANSELPFCLRLSKENVNAHVLSSYLHFDNELNLFHMARRVGLKQMMPRYEENQMRPSLFMKLEAETKSK